MELDEFLEKDILHFLEERREKKAGVNVDREEDYGLYLTKDYLKEVTRALEKDEISEAERLFDELKAHYDTLPRSSLEAKKIYSILEKIYSKINAYVQMKGDVQAIQSFNDILGKGFNGALPRKIRLETSKLDKKIDNMDQKLTTFGQEVEDLKTTLLDSRTHVQNVSGGSINVKDATVNIMPPAVPGAKVAEPPAQENEMPQEVQSGVHPEVQQMGAGESPPHVFAVPKRGYTYALNEPLSEGRMSEDADPSSDIMTSPEGSQTDIPHGFPRPGIKETDTPFAESALEPRPEFSIPEVHHPLMPHIAPDTGEKFHMMLYRIPKREDSRKKHGKGHKKDSGTEAYSEDSAENITLPIFDQPHTKKSPSESSASPGSKEISVSMKKHKSSVRVKAKTRTSMKEKDSKKEQALIVPGEDDLPNFDSPFGKINPEEGPEKEPDKMQHLELQNKESSAKKAVRPEEYEDVYSKALKEFNLKNYGGAAKLFGRVLEMKPTHKASIIRLRQCEEAMHNA